MSILTKIKKYFNKNEDEVKKTHWDVLSDYILSYTDEVSKINPSYGRAYYSIPYNKHEILIDKNYIYYTKKGSNRSDAFSRYENNITNFLPETSGTYYDYVQQVMCDQDKRASERKALLIKEKAHVELFGE